MRHKTFLMVAVLFLSMVFGTKAVQAGYHPFFRRRFLNQYQWSLWGLPVWTTSTVEDLYWQLNLNEGSTPRLYYDHYGQPTEGSCILVNEWMDCSATQPTRQSKPDPQ